jgi:hypothetical protein
VIIGNKKKQMIIRIGGRTNSITSPAIQMERYIVKSGIFIGSGTLVKKENGRIA